MFDSSTGAIGIRPLYYGMLLFSELVANYSHWVPAHASNLPSSAVAHATRDHHGRVKVLLVMKDLNATAAATISVSVSGATGSRGTADAQAAAYVVRLVAPGASATSGITLAGQTFDGSTDGAPLGARQVEPLSANPGGVYTVSMQPLSAAMLVVE